LYRRVESVHVDVDNLPNPFRMSHLSRHQKTPIPDGVLLHGIAIYRPADVPFIVKPFDHYAVGSAPVSIIKRHRRLTRFVGPNVWIPVDRRTDVVDGLPLGGIVFGRIKGAFGDVS